MEKTSDKKKITVDVDITQDMDTVWKAFTEPEHIVNWYFASDDWHAPTAENDLREGGKFKTRMEAKDGSFGFDFEGRYLQIQPHKFIAYQLDDGRNVKIYFKRNGDVINVSEEFEAENTNTEDMQKTGWQSILNNFRDYAEQL